MANQGPSGKMYGLRMPQFMADQVVAFANNLGYTGPTGEILWGEALRHLIAAGLDHWGKTETEVLRTAYFNGSMRAWTRTRDAVIAALNAQGVKTDG